MTSSSLCCRSACHVVYTDYRPTPLQHFMFPSGGDGLYLIVDERSTFREDNFQKAIAALNSTPTDGGALLSHAHLHHTVVSCCTSFSCSCGT